MIFTDKEKALLLGLVDTGIKQHGIQLARDNSLVTLNSALIKLQTVFDAENKLKETPKNSGTVIPQKIKG